MLAHTADYLATALDESGTEYTRHDRYSPRLNAPATVGITVSGKIGDLLAAVATAAADIATSESPNASVEDFALDLRDLSLDDDGNVYHPEVTVY